MYLICERERAQKRDPIYPCLRAASMESTPYWEGIPLYDGIKMCSIVDTYTKIQISEVKIDKSEMGEAFLERSVMSAKEKKLIQAYLKSNSPTQLPDAETYEYLDFGNDSKRMAGAYPSFPERLKIMEELNFKEAKELLNKENADRLLQNAEEKVEHNRNIKCLF